MKTAKSLIGRVVIWGLLGVGVYTVVNMLTPYFSSVSQMPKSIQNKVKIIQKSVNDTSEKATEKIKEVYKTVEKRIVNDAKEKKELQIVDNNAKEESKIYNKNSTPLKRLGNIADRYINQTNLQVENKETTSSALVTDTDTPGNQKNKDAAIRKKEQEIFARQLSVIDELLE